MQRRTIDIALCGRPLRLVSILLLLCTNIDICIKTLCIYTFLKGQCLIISNSGYSYRNFGNNTFGLLKILTYVLSIIFLL